MYMVGTHLWFFAILQDKLTLPYGKSRSGDPNLKSGQPYGMADDKFDNDPCKPLNSKALEKPACLTLVLKCLCSQGEVHNKVCHVSITPGKFPSLMGRGKGGYSEI